MEDARVGSDIDPIGIFGIVEHGIDGMVGQVAGTVTPGAAAVRGLEDVSGPESADNGVCLIRIVGPSSDSSQVTPPSRVYTIRERSNGRVRRMEAYTVFSSEGAGAMALTVARRGLL